MHSRRTDVRRLAATPRGRDFLGSLAVLGGVWIFAVIGLLMQDNVPKLVRISFAFAGFHWLALRSLARAHQSRMAGTPIRSA